MKKNKIKKKQAPIAKSVKAKKVAVAPSKPAPAPAKRPTVKLAITPADALKKNEPVAVSADESDAARAKQKTKSIEQLVALGKEKGFLTYDDINKILPGHVTSSDEIEDVLGVLASHQIEVAEAEDSSKD